MCGRDTCRESKTYEEQSHTNMNKTAWQQKPNRRLSTDTINSYRMVFNLQRRIHVRNQSNVYNSAWSRIQGWLNTALHVMLPSNKFSFAVIGPKHVRRSWFWSSGTSRFCCGRFHTQSQHALTGCHAVIARIRALSPPVQWQGKTEVSQLKLSFYWRSTASYWRFQRS